MLYQDGVNGVIILGGAFAAGMFGWATMEIGLFGILLNVVAIAGCFAAGRLDQKLGSRITILISLALLLLATVGIVSTEKGSTLFGWIQLSTADNDRIFATGAEKAYLLYGVLIGLAFGPVRPRRALISPAISLWQKRAVISASMRFPGAPRVSWQRCRFP